jgi:hypothetical protein
MYENIILPLVIYGCETLFLILRDKHSSSIRKWGTGENIWTILIEVIGGWMNCKIDLNICQI